MYVADQLFATLDTRTKRWRLPHWGEVLLSDTVGFVRHLPHHLIASFKSTLEEARHADLLLHVVDASHAEAERQIDTVHEVLEEIGVERTNMLLVLNKTDRVADRSIVDVLRAKHENSLTISALEQIGIHRLEEAVVQRIGAGFVLAEIETDAGNGKLFAYLSQHAEIQRQDYTDNRVRIACRIDRRYLNVIDGEETTVTMLDGEVAAGGRPSCPVPSPRRGEG